MFMDFPKQSTITSWQVSRFQFNFVLHKRSALRLHCAPKPAVEFREAELGQAIEGKDAN